MEKKLVKIIICNVKLYLMGVHEGPKHLKTYFNIKFFHLNLENKFKILFYFLLFNAYLL